MKLLQIPYSHNCVKVRKVLELKRLQYETVDIAPPDRRAVREASGQGLVPVLVDAGRTVVDSTAIVLYLEEKHPTPALLPASAAERAECLVLEDWADQAFMALTRRLAYARILSLPGALEKLFFPRATGLRRRILGTIARRLVRRRFDISERRHGSDVDEARRVARLAVDRLAGRRYLVGETLTLADVGLASMSAPLWVADPVAREDPAVRGLLEWGRELLGEEHVSFYMSEESPAGQR